MFYLSRSLAIAALLLSTTACGDDPVNTPTNPTVPTVTETFSGSLNPNGGATHTFVTAGPGALTATLKAVGPDSAMIMGLYLGTWNGSSCTVVTADDDATTGTVVNGTVTGAGLLCARVYDVGRFTGQTTYELEVVHP